MTPRLAMAGIDAVFVYTREAHPGERFPAHRSAAQKRAHARAFAEHTGTPRPVLIDGLDGALHRAYGLLPNMTYLVARGGRIAFRSDWTDPATCEAAVAYLLAARERRGDGRVLKPFYAEVLGWRWNSPDDFQAGLELAGPQAVDDFRRATERWQTRPIPGRIDPVGIDEH